MINHFSLCKPCKLARVFQLLDDKLATQWLPCFPVRVCFRTLLLLVLLTAITAMTVEFRVYGDEHLRRIIKGVHEY